MKKSALVTIGSLLAVFAALAGTQSACKLSIVDCGDADCIGGGGDGGGGGGDGGGGGGDSGDGGGGGGGGDGGGCQGLNNISFNDPQNANCDTCMEANCCAEVTTCFGDTKSDCTVVFTCIDGCAPGDKQCEDDCVGKVSKEGTDQLKAVEGCLKNKCDPQCPPPIPIP